jgi:ribonuclease HIII
LRSQEESRIPIRKIEEKFNIQDPSLQAQIQEALEQLQPRERRQEPYCQYVFRFERGQEHLVVKQYQKGTLQIQGTAGELYKALLECVVPRYNLHYPKAQQSIEVLLQSKGITETAMPSKALPSMYIQEVPLPYIGTDESGKGDYFGPMVIAGVLLDSQTKPKLETLGVKDSKLLSDTRCRELAAKIREICKGKYEEVELPPERYNELYDSFQREGKNLNYLLAWGHARAIESLLDRFSCDYAVADQFGDERYILSKLMEKGKKLKLVQLPKGEKYPAVAAASILARDRFLARLERLGQEYGVELPKGASEVVVTAAKRIVEKKGSAELRKLVKLHHRTTGKVLGKE